MAIYNFAYIQYIVNQSSLYNFLKLGSSLAHINTRHILPFTSTFLFCFFLIDFSFSQTYYLIFKSFLTYSYCIFYHIIHFFYFLIMFLFLSWKCSFLLFLNTSRTDLSPASFSPPLRCLFKESYWLYWYLNFNPNL